MVDKDDGNVRSLHEALHSVLNVLERCALVHHQDVRLPVLVKLPNPAEEEAHAGVLVSDDPDQLSAFRELRVMPSLETLSFLFLQ